MAETAIFSMGGLSNSRAKKLMRAKEKAQPAAGTRCAFRETEKVYLSRNPPPDYSHVIDFRCPEQVEGLAVHQPKGKLRSSFEDIGKASDGQGATPSIYTIKNHPGLFMIPGALSPRAQRNFIKSCMQDMTRLPNINNLDTHYNLPKNGLWYHYEQHVKCPSTNLVVSPKHPASDNFDGSVKAQTCGRKLIADAPLTSQTSREVLKAKREAPPPSTNVKSMPISELMHKLRWTNLGLMYHWTSKSYHYEEVLEKGSDSMIKVPTELAELSKSILSIIPIELIPPTETWSDFEPESGIINFYQLKDTLMGHIDQSELVENKPLVSLSFGHTTVFLIGGNTRDIKPTAIYLRSGDALIMSGACRRAYHGVPRIVEGSLPKYLQESTEWDDADQLSDTAEEKDEWSVFARYMSTTRININVRQVFPKGYLDTPYNQAVDHV